MLTNEVLGVSKFDEEYFAEKIKGIQVATSNLIIFVFHDGSTVEKEWSYKSRNKGL